MTAPTPATRRAVERSRREQGLPPTVVDPVTIAKIATLVDVDEEQDQHRAATAA